MLQLRATSTVAPQCAVAWQGAGRKERCSNTVYYSAGARPDTCASHAAARRRGGISPLRVSTPHELKSCPSTSPTHPGIPEQSLRHAIVAIYGWAKGRRWCFRTDCRSCHTSLYEHMAEQTDQPTAATQQAAHRRRGGIEPLRVSTLHELAELNKAHSTSGVGGGGHIVLLKHGLPEAAAPAGTDGRANTAADHVHRTSHTSPERRTPTPACLHAP